MSDNTLVKPLLDLPESIFRIGFVEKLTEAVTHPERTAKTYVVTPPIAEAFDKALRLVGSSLRDNRSQASFLHGSFGSGKSHFMALLSLLLDGNEAAWRVPELHPLRPKHEWAGKKKLLQLHFHMVGQHSLEEAIFVRYLDLVREQHPSAPVPGLFADEKLFRDARALLDELGDDDKFFAPMNESGDAEWGTFGGGEAWTRERFDEVSSSSDAKLRAELFSALVKSRFRAYAEESRQYVDLDTGLGVIGRHAKALGYDAVVLFLDELILWLASRASDVAWFHNEVQKMVKLVEAQEAHRDIPFVSFIARQRDLAEMVGDDYAGFENKLVRDSLQWSEGRYETIKLDDRNLPAIVEKRVLKPKDDDARATLDQAFAKLQKGTADLAWRTMLSTTDAGDFRRLYPFSPALVDALVALSNSLQRERTAIKLLTEILVEHIDDLPVGEVVGVGDLWDVLAGGEDTAEGVMRSRFESAKQTYSHRFLPMLQEHNHTNTPETCQRLRANHPARLGCSNCRNTKCRTDNRLVKTLLIAALVPEVPALKEMTASRLAQLNHGSLKVPIPGTEAGLIAQKVSRWAREVAQLHVGSQPDPTVSLQLEGVELKPILAQAQNHDSPGGRQRVLRDLLFEAMGVEKVADWGRDHKHKDWRGTDRLGHIRFGNVRKMGPDALRCPDDHDWRLIVDYPFDDAGFGPHDDEKVAEEFREQTGGSWTLVWLPTFFSHATNKVLGELAILEHILSSPSTTKGYLAHLSVEQQSRAANDLENLHTQQRSHILQVLEQAYGLTAAREGDLDAALSVENHLHVLKAGAKVMPALAANLSSALDSFVPALLEARYPRHPRFTVKLSKQRVDKLVEKLGDIVDSEEKRIPADKDLVSEMRGTLGELGLVRVTETAVHLLEDRTLQELENKRAQQANDRPEVGELRRWIDETGKMGLQDEALDLVVRCYARWSARTFMSGDRPYEPIAGKPIPDYVVLEKPDLPSHEEWGKALRMAGDAFGISLAGKALHADNLKRFEAALRDKLKEKAQPCTRLPGALARRLTELDLSADVDRATTAASADQLCASLTGKSAKPQVEALAAFLPKTSARAVGASIGSVSDVLTELENNLVFGQFTQLKQRQGELPGATELLERVAQALRQDELNEAAASRVRALAEEAQRIMTPPAQPPVLPPVQPPAGATRYQATLAGRGRANIVKHLEETLAAVRSSLDDADEDVVMTGHIQLVGAGKKR